MRKIGLFATLALGLAGCSNEPESAHTLYQGSQASANTRVHVATFDSASGEASNRANCELVRDLLKSQPGRIIPFWCEKGRFSVK